MEPPPSFACAIGTMPAATAAAEDPAQEASTAAKEAREWTGTEDQCLLGCANDHVANAFPDIPQAFGLEQHVTWTKPLRAQDRFAFEARDRPWQPDWGIPKTRPWIEGLWVVRRGGMLDGDELIYRVEYFF